MGAPFPLAGEAGRRSRPGGRRDFYPARFLAGSAVELSRRMGSIRPVEASSFRSFEAVNGEQLRAAAGGQDH